MIYSVRATQRVHTVKPYFHTFGTLLCSFDRIDHGESSHYRGVLFAFMRNNDNIHYADDFVFVNEHLKEATAGDVVVWFSFKAYGTDVPGPEDKPLHAQSKSIKHWKKALSYYMPN